MRASPWCSRYHSHTSSSRISIRFSARSDLRKPPITLIARPATATASILSILDLLSARDELVTEQGGEQVDVQRIQTGRGQRGAVVGEGQRPVAERLLQRREADVLRLELACELRSSCPRRVARGELVGEHAHER